MHVSCCTFVLLLNMLPISARNDRKSGKSGRVALSGMALGDMAHWDISQTERVLVLLPCNEGDSHFGGRSSGRLGCNEYPFFGLPLLWDLAFAWRRSKNAILTERPGTLNIESSQASDRAETMAQFLPGVVFAEGCEFLLVFLGEGLGSGSGGWSSCVGPTRRGWYSRKAVFLPKCFLEGPFLEPLLRTLLRTPPPSKTH